MSRRNARENAFKMIFVMNADNGRENIPDEFFEESKDKEIWSGGKNDGEDKEYILKVFEGVKENVSSIDETIEKYLKNWTLDRINKVCLAALRLAVYEISNLENVPVKVTASEIVEIVKKYAGEEESKFVNGMLGEYIRKEID